MHDEQLNLDDLILIMKCVLERKEKLELRTDPPADPDDIAAYEQVLKKVIVLRDALTPPAVHADPLDDLRRVGPNKPVGSLPLSEISELGQDVETLKEEAEGRGMATMVFGPGECDTIGGALYVFDRESLQHFLNERKDVLEAADWPSEAVQYIQKIATSVAPQKTELFNLVADSFADTSNTLRM